MAAEEIEIDTSALKQDASTMTQKLDQIKTEIDGMYEAVQQLSTMWRGPANQAFVQQFQNDYETMQCLCQTIQSLAYCMSYAAQEYCTGENAVNGIVEAIKI